MTIRVLLVDDQEMVRAGFAMILDAQPDIEVAGEAADGEQAIAESSRLVPGVIVMDIQMPNLDGVSATRAILGERHDAPRVLVVTTFDIDEYLDEALRAGASGFLLKNAPPEELVQAIRVVGGGRQPPRSKSHQAGHRGVLPAPQPADSANRTERAHRARTRGPRAGGTRTLQQRNRPAALWSATAQ
jgi:DNA-binding NarL/FixJ family response regulator